MTFEEYADTIGVKTTKRDILQILWLEGDTFPRNFVSGSDIMILTDQKNFDRRVRELRDEYGCDIETKLGLGLYRLVSDQIKQKNLRGYLAPADKKKLFVVNNNSCCVCKKSDTRIQADHKVPLSRSGGNEIDNWQTLCVDCNIQKKSACSGCQDDCKSCSWAYPENMKRDIRDEKIEILEQQVEILLKILKAHNINLREDKNV
jgi:hypothetical protein